MADLLELQTNVPQVVALAYSDGKEFPSKHAGAPPQVMFTLVDGRRVFWPQPFAVSLRNSGIAANVPFEVVKREVAKGKTELQFRLIAPPPAAPAPPATHYDNAYRDHTPAPHYPEAPAPAPLPSNALTPIAARFSAADMVAIDTLIAAREYAQRKGLALEIRCEDVRARAATIMIEQSKGGR